MSYSVTASQSNVQETDFARMRSRKGACMSMCLACTRMRFRGRKDHCLLWTWTCGSKALQSKRARHELGRLRSSRRCNMVEVKGSDQNMPWNA
ncbi:hypothetical protein HBI56_015550 [Parastagonospora nodorum]|uniref:Uncharacterized protein n=1 Tax=Phaeosphaeria nodorum (strain SN15 / ATCC MYA-4574 / FGSC 10173) TaxID=321614 RepID=A0A7U2F131_PHANO|nr:hypothetical protein HBH56_084450 [Parastagonospora nodorum]QRC96819.1 hypothetical protein JI435_017090 [Parastagonospora nodorum SN15]KAH3930035.1 hypothetical protein HBH54_117390 [Parastagonospora nodorum]KAH3955824.1 hypothetical protein HBH53_007190 [Parastagonospora nodorum]KAH3976762.1 hypothetical protein HBH51_074320 [Parastagonospora nodorum]